MATNYTPAPDVRAVGDWIIAQHFPKLLEAGVRIEYAYRDDVPKSGGREQWADTKLIASYAAYLAGEPGGSVDDDEVAGDDEADEDEEVIVTGGSAAFDIGNGLDDDDNEARLPRGQEPFFFVWVSEPIWRKLPSHAKAGLIHERLCAMKAARSRSGGLVLKKVRPDFSGFHDNIATCGHWHESLADAFKTMREAGQLELPIAIVGETEKRPRLTVVGMGEMNEHAAVMLARCEAGHGYDRIRFAEGCPICADAAFANADPPTEEELAAIEEAGAALAGTAPPAEADEAPAEAADPIVADADPPARAVTDTEGASAADAPTDDELAAVAAAGSEPAASNGTHGENGKPAIATDKGEWREHVDAKRRRARKEVVA